MTLSLLFDMLTATGRCGGGLNALADLLSGRLGVDTFGWTVEGGVEEPYTEFSVDDDFVVGTVQLESTVPSEPLGDSCNLLDLRLVFRLRKSLKKGIILNESSMPMVGQQMSSAAGRECPDMLSS